MIAAHFPIIVETKSTLIGSFIAAIANKNKLLETRSIIKLGRSCVATAIKTASWLFELVFICVEITVANSFLRTKHFRGMQNLYELCACPI